jgi:hypothetical protein
MHVFDTVDKMNAEYRHLVFLFDRGITQRISIEFGFDGLNVKFLCEFNFGQFRSIIRSL